MIASGGCTAAALVAGGQLDHLHLVDMNPAQMGLSCVKLHLLQNASPLDRLKILGHAPMTWGSRSAAIAQIMSLLGLKRDTLGPLPFVTKHGLDHAGRYELVFARLRAEMIGFSAQLTQIANHSDAAVRVAAFSPDAPLGRAMDKALDSVMALPNLVRLFGGKATQNSVEPFSRHFAGRLRYAVATLEPSINPWFQQMLLGRFPRNVVYAWLTAVPPRRMPQIVMSTDHFDKVLGVFRREFDFVHLSNILDWLSADEAMHTLQLAWNALRPGGVAIIRQLNSSLVFSELGPQFDWLDKQAQEMNDRDRSFFYRKLLLGRKQ
jgi:S-adenosylmethionine-diacylglycerol 3-amino-3-carboxypropyl transferase